jgi:hypothetical protein
VAIVAALSVARSHLPAVSTTVRRTLGAPYLLAAGGIFRSVVHELIGPLDLTGQSGGSFAGVNSSAASVAGLLVLGAAVYYAMLI